MENVAWYWQRYTGKPLQPETVGQESLEEAVRYVSDIVKEADGVLKTVHGEHEPSETVLRVTEVARRERQNRIAAGDESAKLVFKKPQQLAKPKGKGKGKGKEGKQQTAPTPQKGGKSQGKGHQPRAALPAPRSYSGGGSGYSNGGYAQGGYSGGGHSGGSG